MMRYKHLILLFALFSFAACEQAQEQALLYVPATSAGQAVKTTSPATTQIVFKSVDGGQSWQDMSAGLPANFEPRGLSAEGEALFIGAEQDVYCNAAKSDGWKKEMFLTAGLTDVSPTSNGWIAYGRSGRFFQKTNGTGVWMPVFTNFTNESVRTVFTAKDGGIFIGCDNGLFKSADQGKTWQHVMQSGWVIKMTESDGVLLCTNERGILRSVDGGEHWDVVVSEGGVGIAVETVKGGFAAITYNTQSKTRRVRISTDGGRTWRPIDEGLPPSDLISSVQQVGDAFYCGHPKGIYRSDDLGKTWRLLLPTIGKKVFNLSVSGDVMYAVLQNGGC